MNQHHNKKLLLGLALWLILTGTYIFSYSGLPLSSDEYIIFDSTQSLVLNGTMARTIGYNVVPSIQEDGTPWPQQKYEPLQVIIAAPLFWLGHQLPNIGRLHTVFTLNIFIMALAALSVYMIALQRGYRLAVAWWGALIFGVATAAWPYSRWIFREPVMSLFVLWAFHFATQIHQRMEQHQSVWRQALLAALAIVAAILTKQIGWLILPAVLISLFPSRVVWRHALPAIVILVLILGTLISVVLFLQPDVEEGRYSVTRWTDLDTLTWKSVPESLLGYHVSPSRSLWLFSPILAVGWIGAVMLWRRGEWRLVLGPALALIVVSASYGVTRQSTVWNGGWGWGPRYMVPFLPVLMLWVLPVLEWLFHKPTMLKQYSAWLAFIPLLMVSVGIQWLGLGVPYTNYYTELQFNLFDDPTRFDEWQKWADYNWVWSESQIPYHWHHFSGDQLKPAWTIVEQEWLMPLLTLMMIVVGIGLCAWVIFAKHGPSLNAALKSAITSVVVLSPILPLGEGIYQLRDDERYISGQSDVFELINILNQEVQPDDIVLIERGEYSRLFMNYFKADAVLMTLPLPLRGGYAPGEPEIRDDELYPALGPHASYALDWAPDHYRRLWLVAASGPFITDAIRPAERLLTIRYFPIREYTVSQKARAILYDTVDVPNVPSVYRTNYIFGELLGLLGYDLPRGTTYQPGDVVPVSIVWSALQPMVTDYNVSVRISDATHLPVVQQDGLPIATFGHTSQWEIGRTLRDNHGLELPADLLPGEYYLEVTVYNYVTGENLEVRNPELGVVPSNRIATLLPITVQENSDD